MNTPHPVKTPLTKTVRDRNGQPVTVRLYIDEAAILSHMGFDAARNKQGRAIAVHGAIVVQVEKEP
jgi:hypothetical protein